MTGRPRMSLLLPEGWVRLRVDDTDTSQIDEVLAQAVATIAPSRRDFSRVILRRRLTDAVARARERGMWDVLLPVAPTAGVSMPASLVAGPLPQEPPTAGSVSGALLAMAGSVPGAQAVEIGGALGLRFTTDTPAEVNAAGEVQSPPTRLVTYVVSPTEATGRWLTFAASIMRPEGGDGAALLEALEFVIDAMLATVTFEGEAA